ncbi:DUF443 family protein [Enterococcus faecium]|nr:DUF443 family protein [Enterococcus faecium]
METARIWIFMKNFRSALRYVILESKSGYYLIDTDHYTFLGGYLFPIFNWIIPHKVMKINLPADKINRLILNKDLQRKREKEHSNVIWIGAAFAVVTSSIVGPMLESIYSDFSIGIRYLFVTLSIAVLLCIKGYVNKKNKDILTLIGVNNLSSTKIILFPESIKEGSRLLIIFIMLILFSVSSMVAFIVSNNWFILAGVMLFSSFYLFSNALLAQRGKYKFKILD